MSVDDFSPDVPGYLIQHKLAAGGMAVVFVAIQERLGRPVAVKVLRPKFVSNDDIRSRFDREGLILADLPHKHIVTVYDRGDEPLPYLVMELVNGGTLRQRLRDGKPLPLADSLRLIREIANALGFAHGKGFIHRDIKPQNILIRDDGGAVLTDFGIGKRIIQDPDSTAAEDLTIPGHVPGTPRWMSPEQAIGATSFVDKRSDLYSLGTLFHAMLTGEIPYDGDSTDVIRDRLVNDSIPGLPEEIQHLQPVLEKLRAKRREDRYQSAEEFVQALDQATSTILPPADDYTQPLPSSKAVATGRSSWRRTLAWAGGGLALLLVLFGVFPILIEYIIKAQIAGEIQAMTGDINNTREALSTRYSSITELENRLQALTGDRDELQQQLAEAEERLRAVQAEFDPQINNLQTTIDGLEKQLAAVDEAISSQQKDFNEEVVDLEAERDQLQEQIAVAEAEQQRQSVAFQEQLSTVRDERDTLAQQLSATEARWTEQRQTLEAQLATAESSRDSLDQELVDLQVQALQEQESAEAAITTVQNEIARLEEQLAGLSSDNSTALGQLGEQLTTLAAQRDTLQNRLLDREETVTAEAEELATLRAELDADLQDDADKLLEADAKLAAMAAERADLEQRLATIAAERQALQDDLATRRTELEALQAEVAAVGRQHAADLEDYQTQQGTLQNQLDQMQASADAIDGIHQQLAALSDDMQSIQVAINALGTLYNDEIIALLREGEAHLAANRLLRPDDGNAFAVYQQIEALPEGSTPARAGYRRIIERYQTLVAEALADGDLDQAQRHVNSAATVEQDGLGIDGGGSLLDPQRQAIALANIQRLVDEGDRDTALARCQQSGDMLARKTPCDELIEEARPPTLAERQAEAEMQLADGRLIDPPGDNALTTFRIIAAMDDGAAIAEEGYRKVLNRLAKRVEDLLADNPAEALNLIGRAQGLEWERLNPNADADRFAALQDRAQLQIAQQHVDNDRRWAAWQHCDDLPDNLADQAPCQGLLSEPQPLSPAVTAKLAEAEDHLANDRLVDPEDDNAFAAFQAIATMDGGPAVAEDGYRKILARLETQVADALAADDSEAALGLIDAARTVAQDGLGRDDDTVLADAWQQAQLQIAQNLQNDDQILAAQAHCRDFDGQLTGLAPCEAILELPPPLSPEIIALRDKAEAHLAGNRLTLPSDDNAYATYQEIAELDGGQAVAEEGYRKIVERYQQLAEEALADDNPSEAMAMIERGHEIHDDHFPRQAILDDPFTPLEIQVQLLQVDDYLAAGELDEALASCQRIAELGGSADRCVDALYDAAVAALNDDDLDTAARYVVSGHRLDREHADLSRLGSFIRLLRIANERLVRGKILAPHLGNALQSLRDALALLAGDQDLEPTSHTAALLQNDFSQRFFQEATDDQRIWLAGVVDELPELLGSMPGHALLGSGIANIISALENIDSAQSGVCGLSQSALENLSTVRRTLSDQPNEALDHLYETMWLAPPEHPSLEMLRQRIWAEVGDNHTKELFAAAYANQVRERLLPAWQRYKRILALKPGNAAVADEIPKLARYTLRFLSRRYDHIVMVDEITREQLRMGVPLSKLSRNINRLIELFGGRFAGQPGASERRERLIAIRNNGGLSSLPCYQIAEPDSDSLHEHDAISNQLFTVRDQGIGLARLADRSLNLDEEQQKQVQTALNNLGFNAGDVDGVIGPGTRTAIESFQVANNFKETGYLTYGQLNVLMQNAELPLLAIDFNRAANDEDDDNEADDNDVQRAAALQ